MKPKTLRELIAAIKAAGYEVQVKGRKNHYAVLRPNGTYLMPIPVSPSDPRSVRNCWSDFKRNLQRV